MTLILSGTNGLSDVDGSAATPAVRGTDANTGIFFGADTVGISTGGTSALSIDASQNITTTNKFAKASMPAGSVLQVVNAVKVDVFSTSNTTYTDITGLSVSITPSSTSSKILVLADVFISTSSTNNAGLVQIVGGSTVLGNNTSSGSGQYAYGAGGSLNDQYRAFTSASLSYLDSPATASSITYKIQIRSAGGTVYMNRWTLNTDIMGSSSITIMEIAA